MTIPLSDPHPPHTLDDDARTDVEQRAWSGSVARAILAHAALVGVAADALLRDGPVGIGFPLWTAIGVLAAISLVWRSGRGLSGESGAWMATAILCACGLAWRDAGMLQLLDVVGTFGALIMAAIALNDRRNGLFAERLRDTIWAAVVVVRDALFGIFPLLLHDLGGTRVAAPVAARGRPVVRAALIALALLLVFGSLLRDADPIFASLVALPDLDVGVVMSHLIVAGFFGWIVAGWARNALIATPTRHKLDVLPFRLGQLDVTAALVTLNVLFALFVLSQIGWFFGGEAFLRERTGLTAATYARAGFFQMVWVVALVVPVLLITRAALQPGRALARRHTALALPVIALLFAIILSAFLRMRLYVHYYGLTADRLYPLVFMAWLGFVLAWLAITVLHDRGRPFVAGLLISAGVVLALLHVALPDTIVARVNIARAEQNAGGTGFDLDLAHLATLSGEAAELATRATLAPSRLGADTPARYEEETRRCTAARVLLSRWGSASRSARRRDDGASWRTWNAGDRFAQRVVAEHAPALRIVMHSACRYRVGR